MSVREEPLWNKAEALESVDGEVTVLQETADVFLQECPKMLSALRDSLAQGDAERFSQSVHRLKGALGCLTTGRVFSTVLRLEVLAAQQDFAAAATVVGAMEQELLGLCRELREFCQVNHEAVNR